MQSGMGDERRLRVKIEQNQRDKLLRQPSKLVYLKKKKKSEKNFHLTMQISARKLEAQQSVLLPLSHRTQIQCDTTFTQSGCDRMLQLKQCV